MGAPFREHIVKPAEAEEDRICSVCGRAMNDPWICGTPCLGFVLGERGVITAETRRRNIAKARRQKLKLRDERALALRQLLAEVDPELLQSPAALALSDGFA